jgi:hypothetical protein
MMRLRLILFALLITFVNLSFAQVRATTESGNKVLLYDNGTWKYEEKIAETAEPEVVAATLATAIAVDSTRIYQTEPEDIFYLPSPRLVKYFGEAKGRIRCKLSCSNNLGEIKLHFGWEFPVVDGNRYYGWFKEGSRVAFTMQDGQVVELLMGNDGELKRYEKRNYSVLTNSSIPLTHAQLAVLTAQPVSKMEVGWKKNPEEYEIEQSRFLMEALPTVF